VANNAIVLALAYDFTHDDRFVAGVVHAADYLLGTNPLAFSYVSGFGEHALQNPHHRFWAHQKKSSFPPPPPGALAGGPNSRLQDPTSNRALRGCARQRCYIDNVDAWSVNEVAINWNAPLAWISAFLDERGGPDQGAP
jgi:endoglucanase